MENEKRIKKVIDVALKFVEVYLLFYFIVFTGFRFMMIEDGPQFIMGIMVCLLLAVWLVYMIANNEIPGTPAYFGVYIFFFLSFMTSVFRSVYLPASLYETLLLSVSSFVFIAIISLVKYGRSRTGLINSLLWVGLIYNALKAVQLVQNFGVPGCGVKFILIPNKTAGFLNLTIMLSLGIILERIYSFVHRGVNIQWRGIVFPGIVYLTSVVLLWFTGSRSGYVAFFAGSTLVLLFHWFYSGRIAYVGNAIIYWLALVVFVVTGVFANRPFTCVSATGDEVVSSAWTTSIDHRIELWGDALDIVGKRPLTGSGPGTFQYIVAPLYDYNYRVTVHPHSIYLKTLAERGIIGFIIGGFLFLTIYKTASLDQPRVAVRLIGVGILIVVMVQGLADAVMSDAPFVARYFLSILGVVVAPVATFRDYAREISEGGEYYE